ncbi:CPBP family intramembrane metalloprotease domain-containing protein [Flavobacterium sp. L1I52]|uniref:CPBP family intramembrane metalloprotease domain-containing protein n=1 Tax=Flavobacterium pokkalii TaxID=1940408 RepID=A0ABR7US59_9FLAO|nr:CPBP family intramembrane glutamic endopeptidase [Flavobacterium pokkalii]MBD0725503.1 CPBP family intramembrane metalloprotease domain-containing protein [Flavobacterium pokkalii]
MFIEQGIRSENKFWKYLLGSGLIILMSFIGQLPLLVAVIWKTFATGEAYPTTNDGMMHFLEANLTLFLLLISFVFAFAGIYFVVKYLHNQTLLSVTTSREKVDWSRIWFSFGLWAVFTIGSTLVYHFLNPELYVLDFKPVPFAILFIIAVFLVPVQTSTEEYVFRGYLMQGFGNLAKNKWFPLLMTSLIFGGMHFFNPEVSKIGNIIFVYYIGTGLFLGIVTLMDEGMELALGFHAANNLIGALLLTSDWSAFQTHSVFKDVSEPQAGYDIIMPVVLVYPLLLFIFSRKYNWSNWKEKLTGTIHFNN